MMHKSEYSLEHKRYAIFDMDGTLIDSMTVWEKLTSEYLASKGITNCPDEILREIETMTLSESSALFAEHFPILGTAEQIHLEMDTMMNEHYQKDIPLKPGVLSYLHKLWEEGTRMCVASATAAPLMEVCLKRLGVREYFEFLLSCEELHTSKRQPDIYFEATKCFQAEPFETAVYEDALYAARTAKNAGFFVVGIYEESLRDDWSMLSSIADETMIFT